MGKQETLDTEIGKLEFDGGYPTEPTMKHLLDEMDFMRSTQAYLWGIPAAGMIEWLNAQTNTFKIRDGQLVSYLTSPRSRNKAS
ncbi:hypothetical protein [Pseudomonas sp. BP01]|uniref:hypothetical protein n=1 Tax=Pseudomonas sp. BP01 TaxID=2976152 RepID=UPI001FAA873C|nr:hypothetical protein [Pseudomonas sp. BP01]